jgi:L-aspartate oxidase
MLSRAGFDVQRDPIPVRPAAHYMMGGIATDLDGSTGVQGLRACGEVASTGIHGANRLAGNSLAEGLVFGCRAGAAAGQAAATAHAATRDPICPSVDIRTPVEPDIRASLADLMDRHLGIIRDAGGLAEVLASLAVARDSNLPPGSSASNLLTLAWCIAASADIRRESRGAHWRSDYPASDPAFLGHVTLRNSPCGIEVDFEPLPASALGPAEPLIAREAVP